MSRHNRRGAPRRRKAPPAPPHPAALFAAPPAGFYALPDLELRGNRLTVQGCRKVLDFTPSKICLDFGSTLLTFYGRRLRIESLVGKRLIATGHFARIEFTEKWPAPEGEPPDEPTSPDMAD